MLGKLGGKKTTSPPMDTQSIPGKMATKKTARKERFFRAGDEIRTHDLLLGKKIVVENYRNVW